MTSKVYFADLRATLKDNLFNKIDRLLRSAGVSEVIRERDLTAVKLHFGEMGNAAFIRPVFIREIIKTIKACNGIPFLTDANTLYAGTRSDAPHHLTTAIQNGFAYAVIAAPIIIADGLRGKNETAVRIDQKNFKTAYIGSDIYEAEAMVSVAHFKGHELSGFGGTIKNIGMGCASRRGKLAQHSTLSPKVKRKKCIGCGDCVEHCSQNALSLSAEDGQPERARIDPEKCIGCGECILICPQEAIQIQWNQAYGIFMENMVEYTYGVLKNKPGKGLFINFVTDVSPACDCYGYNDAPIVKNIGILAATDPVAIDQAAVDLVNREPVLSGTCIKEGREPVEDKFRAIYPQADWNIQLEYAEKIGLGKREYELEKV